MTDFKKNPEFYVQTKSYAFSGQVDFVLNVLKNMLTLNFVISDLLFHITVQLACILIEQ